MKAHTSDYKDKIKEFGKQITSKITYELEGETIELGAEELNSITPHYEGSILKSVMKQLDIDSNVDIPLGTILNYQFGLFVDRYTETTDETYQADIEYYVLEDDEFVLLVVGTDYEVGDEIEDTVYNYQDYEYLNFGNYVVYSSEKKEDTNSYNIICYDKMLYSMVDYEDIQITYPITIRNYISAICNHLGLTFKNENSEFANWNRQIQSELYLDNGGNSLNYKFRDVLDELAQVTASTICINEEDDELEIRYITDTYDTIDEEYLKNINVKFGEQYGPINSIVLSRSGESDNVYLQDAQSITDNGLCEIKIIDNQIMNWNDRSDYLPDILAKLDGLQYYINDYNSPGITYYNLCDRYNVSIGENTYSCVMFNNELDITQGLEELVHTDLPEETETDYSKADKTDRKINQTYLVVDKQNQVISSVINNVSEQNNKISQITQTVDELNSKIQDIADITISGESEYGTFELDNINESEPIMIKVRPLNGLNNISYLYPRSNLYPSSSLYMPNRKIRFANITKYELTTDKTYNSFNKYYSYDSVNDEYTLLIAGTDYIIGNKITGSIYQNQIIDYEIPDDLLYYDGTHYDEFYLDYDSQTCQIIKKCEYNSDGTISPLANEITNTYTYPTIPLSDGDYEITLLGYSNAYLFVRLMASNIYTSQFATRVEMSSAIQQSANEINLRVDEKVDEEDFTHANIVLKINDDTSQAQIHADKVDIDATDVFNILAGNTINLTSNNIAIDSTHFKVTKQGNLTCSNANVSGSITASSISGSTISGSTISGGTIKSNNNYLTINLANGEIDSYSTINFYNQLGSSTEINGPTIDTFNVNAHNITTTSITAQHYNQGSLESIKKNINLCNKNGLNIINNSDIYEFNYKTESNNEKKHIGLIINDAEKKYNTPKEILTETGTGIDLYSMISISWKAIQEQQKTIDNLLERIEKLERNDK